MTVNTCFSINLIVSFELDPSCFLTLPMLCCRILRISTFDFSADAFASFNIFSLYSDEALEIIRKNNFNIIM